MKTEGGSPKLLSAPGPPPPPRPRGQMCRPRPGFRRRAGPGNHFGPRKGPAIRLSCLRRVGRQHAAGPAAYTPKQARTRCGTGDKSPGPAARRPPRGVAEPAGQAGGFLESGQGLQDRLSRCSKAKSRFTRTVSGVGWAHTAARRCSPTWSCVRTSMVSTLSQHRSKDFFMPGRAPQSTREQ